jgi:hypothetical protein
VLANPASGAPSGPLSDPVLEAGIVAAGELEPFPSAPPIPNGPDPTAATYKVPVASLNNGQPILIAGQPTVTLRATTTATRLQLDVRLYDVSAGVKELITRGTYTEDGGVAPLGTIVVTIPTAGNLWRMGPGRLLQLEITNVDAPYIAPSRVPSATQISEVRLTIPVR